MPSLWICIRSTLGGDYKNYMARVAKIYLAVMIAVYFVSHAPALPDLDIPGFHENGNLLFFLAIVVQFSDVMQYVWASCWLSQSRANHKPQQDLGRTYRWYAVSRRYRNDYVLDDTLQSVAGRSDGIGNRRHGLQRRACDVSYQARCRREGLRPSYPRPWRYDGSHRLIVFRSADLFHLTRYYFST